MPKGALVIISGPSGAGKTTVCRKLLQRRKDLRYSVSCTTRAPRPGERDGRHYHFLDPEEFKRRLRRHELLEYAMVHGHYYGTPRHFIESSLRAGHWVLLAIDVQGAAAVRRKLPDSVRIFLLPPSWEELRLRLSGRREDAEGAATRLDNARAELAAAKDYDYMVVNDELERAVDQIECIITAESLKSCRQDAAILPKLPAAPPKTHPPGGTMTKKDAQPKLQVPKHIEELILDYKQDKYSVVPLAALWAKELHRREENRHMTANEILELALREVLTGVVDWKTAPAMLAAAGGAAPAAAAADEGKKSKE